MRTLWSRLLQAVGSGLACILVSLNVYATSVTTDVTDIWWNPNEDGWGMQLVQEDNTVFATLFIYGPDTRPTWAVAVLYYQGGLVFSGNLYVTTGPYFGSFFNPGAVTRRQAGTMTVALQTVSTATVSYSIDGVPVSKQIQRQYLDTDNYNGSYVALVNLSSTGCSNPTNNGDVNGVVAATISQTPSTMNMSWVFSSGGSCTYAGGYAQTGRFGGFSGSYSCTTGEVGTMTFFEMTNRVGMMSGRLSGRSSNIGCSYSGRFTGLNPSTF